jgi:hypothetical protein
LIVLVYVNYHSRLERAGIDHQFPRLGDWFVWFRDAAIWITIIVTIMSGLLYIQRAMSIYRGGLLDAQRRPARV